MNQTATPARPPFQPTADMIEAAETLFLAIAYEQTVRPVVEAYQRKVLAERRWEVDPLKRTNADEIEYVEDIEFAWLMSETDHAIYHKRCNEERRAAKLDAAVGASCDQDDHCPLSVAKNTVREARFVLCDAMAGITKIPGAKAVTLQAADYDKLVDMSLSLLAPFVKNPLPRLMA